MKNHCLFFLMLLGITLGNSQVSPTLKSKNKLIGLSSLSIKVEVVGNRATTTYDMLYYNPTDEILEGELSFPLGDGHNVSRFALDVNDKLREAVVVDKELGRIAFEQVVRRGVDPALLEKGTGNNYKARIYPIPANGYKRVLLAYEQELILNDNEQFFNLPLNFKNKLDKFNLEIIVFDQMSKPIIEKGEISGLEFRRWEKNFCTIVSKEKYIPKKSLLIKIPTPLNTEKLMVYGDYFYFHRIVSPHKKIRPKPNRITIFWDNSMSMENRELDKELSLLSSYFEYLQNVEVELISFSNSISKKHIFRVVNGDWKLLKEELINTIYDGGTSYDILDSLGEISDVNILFSDGITCLSETIFNTKTPIFVINSLTKSNFSALNHLAELSNGLYINLKIKSISEALEGLKYEAYKFLGFRSESKDIELYPKAGGSISNDFTLSGKNIKEGDEIFLDFGYENEVLNTFSIIIKGSEIENKTVQRIWAQKKLNGLQIDSRKNKKNITKLGVDYGLVTDYTSLIVLEDVRDYITYKITPPDDLLEEYNKILTSIESKKEQHIRPHNIDDSENANVFFEEEAPIRALIPRSSQSNAFFEVSDSNASRLLNDNATNVVEEISEVEVIELFEESIPFSQVEVSPTFPDCDGNNQEKKECFQKRINEHIKNNFNKQLADELNLSGRVRINTLFTINTNGEIENIRVRSPHEKLDEEVKRVFRLLPIMKPARQRGRNVNVSYAIPIVFGVGGSDNNINVQEPQLRYNYNRYSGRLEVNDRLIDTDYINALRKTKNKNDAYNLYLKQRRDYLENPAYYIDVSNYFKETYNDNTYSIKILSNIAEVDFDNYELLKAFAYELQSRSLDNLALFVFQRILELRPEDVQSYRDLGLAYQNVGRCQKALELFNDIITDKVYENSHRRSFEGVKLITKNEMRYLIQNYKDDLDLSKISPEFLNEIDFNIRVVVDWNHNDTDIDLHIIDPDLEECFYQHPKTNIGGKISPDMTQGFGPEEFVLKKAIKGDYFIKVKYYGDRYQKIENPTFMKVTMYKNYGEDKEIKETKIIRLTKKDDEEIIAKLSF